MQDICTRSQRQSSNTSVYDNSDHELKVLNSFILLVATKNKYQDVSFMWDWWVSAIAVLVIVIDVRVSSARR